MKLQVLISCMFDVDCSIVKRSNIQSDAIVVNQCDIDSVKSFDFINNFGKSCHVKYINTTQRGLSKSRNMAIRNADADICLLCDDDEILDNDYAEKIINIYLSNPTYDLIAFKVRNLKKDYPMQPQKIGLWQCAKISSVQISFKRSQLILSNLFNENMGSGSGNGAGEENKFLVDLWKKGSKMVLYPIDIGMLLENSSSSWFYGYTSKYHRDRGWAAKQIYGYIAGIIYLSYSLIFRIKKYDKENSWIKIVWWTIRGFFEYRG